MLALLVLLAAPVTSDDPLAALGAKLRASDKWTRVEAVEELARVGSEPAWRLVIQALADPKGEVADTAEVVLAALEGERALDELLGAGGLEAGDALVRARAAEVLGRLVRSADGAAEARSVAALAKALGDREAEVRRMAAWSLERLGRAQRLGPVQRESAAEALARRQRSEREELGAGRMLAALVVLDRGAARAPFLAARRERSAHARAVAAALAPEALEPGEAEECLGSLVEDPEPAVRRAAVEALAALGTPAALARLVARLPLEGEERLAGRLVEHLQGLSGLKHRRDPRPWNDWLGTLPEDWRPGPRASAPREDPAPRTSVALAGLPIVSKRVAILIDLSGSIWNVRPDGRTRKQVVDGKLREALEALPPDTRFNLVPYTGTPIPWKPRLVPASPARVREAAAWFEARRESGSGNFWDAAMLALEDPEVDTLVVLFDGAPTGGTRHRLELIVPLFLERNLGRQVAVDLVLVDASRKLQRAWGELVAGTAGRLVSVTF